jgi:protein involved in polysaccharide export with SLBB domain
MLKKLLLIQILLLVAFCGIAQVPSLSKEQVKQVKVDNLSDDQIRQLVTEMKAKNISFSDIDQYALQKGVSAGEISKLKDRITQLGLEKEISSKNTTSPEAVVDDNFERKSADKTNPPQKKVSKIFGSELFTNQNLTFEPNLRLPTPTNYKLAAEDELIIDVYGNNEITSRLKINPDGYIRIPNIGPVYVNGLTIEEAKIRISKQLSSIYSGIKTGNTSVQLTLGNIRSIRILMIGEVERPGTYTLPSLATIANALYVSGGPNSNGSFRKIQLIRNGQTFCQKESLPKILFFRIKTSSK